MSGTDKRGVLFVPYKDTLGLLGVQEAFDVCERVYRMHAEGSVVLASPPSFKLDVAGDFHNHWHVKGVFLKGIGIGILWAELAFLALYAALVFFMATRKMNQKLL